MPPNEPLQLTAAGLVQLAPLPPSRFVVVCPARPQVSGHPLGSQESRLASVLAYLATAALGLLAGAMLLIALAIVPFWVTLEPIEFARWFRTYSPLLGRVMLPLGASATLLAVIAASFVRPVFSAASCWLVSAAALPVAAVGTYPLYFSSSNAALAGGRLEEGQVSAELLRWRTWHWVRTVAGLLAFLAALCGVSRLS